MQLKATAANYYKHKSKTESFSPADHIMAPHISLSLNISQLGAQRAGEGMTDSRDEPHISSGPRKLQSVRKADKR